MDWVKNSLAAKPVYEDLMEIHYLLAELSYAITDLAMDLEKEAKRLDGNRSPEYSYR